MKNEDTIKTKKYLLAVDSYTFDGVENIMPMVFNGEELKQLKQLDNNVVECYNIENYVGGGESLDYDLYQIDSNLPVVLFSGKHIDKKIEIDVTFSEIEINKDNLVAFIHSEYDDKAEVVEVKTHNGNIFYKDIDELKSSVAENDISMRTLADVKDFSEIFMPH